MAQVWDLIGDIGGTNMRLAACRDGQLGPARIFATKGGMHLSDAIETFAADIGTLPDRAVVAAAGPVRDGVVTLTNSGMRIDQRDIAKQTNHGVARVLNDFEAAAWSQVEIDRNAISTIHGQAAFPAAPRLIMGPGTGLGVGSIVWHEAGPVVIPGEGGHVRVAAQNAREMAIYATYARLFPEFVMGQGVALEAEAVASGTGIPNLYAAIAETDGTPAPAASTKEIFAAARSGDAIATETVTLCCTSIARIAGDLALFLNAAGGVFICGGVAAANPWAFDNDAVRDGFTAGGRFTDLRQSYALHLVTSGEFGLLGGINYLKHSRGPSSNAG